MSENTSGKSDEGLVTGDNFGRGGDDVEATNPEEFASGESDLALSNQVEERESDGGEGAR